MKSICELVQALDGGLVPVVRRGAESFRLGSSYNGRYAAERWADRYVEERVENVILFGLGDCHIVLQLLRKVPGYVLVYEPDPAIFQEVRRSPLFAKFRDEQKLYILYGGEDQWIPLRDVITDILNDDCVETTAVLTHPGYLARYQEEYKMLMDVCEMVCDAMGFTQGAIQRHMEAMLANIIDNIPYMKDGVPLARLAKYWDPDVPVIMVAAGPSLKKNMEVLRQIDQRAYLFCADAALPTLLKAGIVPDLVASTDGIKNMNCFEEPGSFDIPYLVSSNTKHEIIKNISSTKIFGYDHKSVRVIFEKQGIEVAQIPAQFGIAAGIFAALTELGTRQIVLVGQDLAYSEDKKSHTEGRDEGFVEEKASLTEGYYGGEVYTRMDWEKFREWFEEMIDLLPSDRVVINATEGGAKIHGSVQMSLQDVIDQLPERRSSFADVVSDERVKISEKEYQGIMADWKRMIADIEKIKRNGYRKTFFETDYHNIPAMDLVIGYMRYLKDVPERKERFRLAVDYVYDEIHKKIGSKETGK